MYQIKLITLEYKEVTSIVSRGINFQPALGTSSETKLSHEVALIIGAWGYGGLYRERAAIVMKMFTDIYYLEMNKSGQSTHPLYLCDELKPNSIKKVICKWYI